MNAKPIKVLLIEDNPGDARLIREMLADARNLSVAMENAVSLSSGLERLAVGGVDVVLLDLGLPDCHGMESFDRVYVKAPDLPIVVLTGLDDEEVALGSVKAGAQDYLVKGRIDTDLLAHAICYAVERKHAEARLRKVNRALKVISECNQSLIRVTDEPGLLDEICWNIVKHGGYVMASVCLAGEDEGKPVIPAARAGYETGYYEVVKPTLLPHEDGWLDPVGRVVGTGLPYHSDDILSDPEFGPWRDEAVKRGYASCVCLPLVVEGLTIGALCIYSAEAQSYDEEERNLLVELAGDLAYGVQTLRVKARHEKAKEMLERLHSRNALILDCAGEGILGLDKYGAHTFINPAAAKMLGWDAAELIGGPSHESWHHTRPDGSCYPRDECPIIAALSDGATHKLSDDVFIRKDGTPLHVEYTSTPIREGGDIVGSVVTFRDITERWEMERQRADFSSMVIHDLKSPLFCVMGYAEMIAAKPEGELDRETKDMAEVICHSGKKLMLLVDNFLTMTSFEAGKMALMRVTEDVGLMLTGVRDEFGPFARNKGITFRLEIGEDIPKARLDKKQVVRAVGNLLHNALYFTPQKGTVTLSAGLIFKEAREYIYISVSDTGRGVPDEDRDKIFSKYYRSSRTSGIKGSGLGLAIVKAVAEAHGGWVELDSEDGKGSEFRMLLPTAQAGL